MKMFLSAFKDAAKDHAWFNNWVKELEILNHKSYQRHTIDTMLGKTVVWSLKEDQTDLPALVIFPGFRTTPLFWDLDNGLNELSGYCRIFLVETNGQPNPSDGNSPEIKSDAYGTWAAEVLRLLNLENCFIAGASFGGLVCMKLCKTNPEMVRAAFLLNPGCLQPFSTSFKNIYYNVLPIIRPSQKNVALFLDKAVFCKPNHSLDSKREKLIIDFEVFALTRYKDKTQKPYYMDKELQEVQNEVYLILGDKDPLFPTQRSVENARKHLRNLKEVIIMPNIGHGIETDKRAIKAIGDIVKKYGTRA